MTKTEPRFRVWVSGKVCRLNTEVNAMSDGTKWHVIRKGFVGWHADGISKEGWSCTGSGGNFDYYMADAADNCLVVDASEVPENDFIHFTISGPMVDLKLPEYAFERLLDPRKEIDPTEAFTQQSLRDDYGINGFTMVGRGIYAHLASQLSNIKLGYVVAGEVAWWGASSANA